MSLVVIIVTALLQAVLLLVIPVLVLFAGWILKDCLVGPSARMAADARRRARREVHGR